MLYPAELRRRVLIYFTLHSEKSQARENEKEKGCKNMVLGIALSFFSKNGFTFYI